MRATNRDRCGSALIALGIAFIIIINVPPVGALSADYQVFPNGTAYMASVDITDAVRYEFSDIGPLGERIPQKVGGVELFGNCSPCTFNWSGSSIIIFRKGNYTVNYIAPLQDNHIQVNFETPYQVNVSLPPEFDVRNPFLAGISYGANVTRYPDNTTIVQWKKTMSIDLRFYDQNRETLLYMFGEFWVIIAIVLLLPFLITMRKNK